MQQTTKQLGGIGYIVFIAAGLLGAVIPFAGIVTLGAAICVALAFIRAADELGRPEIKSSVITAIVLNVIAVAILVVMLGGVIMAVLAAGNDLDGLGAALGGGAALGALVSWVLMIVASWFWYKASKPVAEATGEKLFQTGGLLIFIGSITVVLFGLGLIVSLIGQILQCVAFFNTNEQPAVASEQPAVASD